MASNPRSVLVAMTGASGAVYGLRLIRNLLAADCRVDLIISRAGRLVLDKECGLALPEEPAAVTAALCQGWPASGGQLLFHPLDDWTSPLASGSGQARPMVICPCSMGTLAAVAHGLADTLLERAADVVLKERWPMILVPRETPLSAIHLKHMLHLAKMGVTILPAMPGFYHHPQSVSDLVDFVVARILDHLGVPQKLVAPWSG